MLFRAIVSPRTIVHIPTENATSQTSVRTTESVLAAKSVLLHFFTHWQTFLVKSKLMRAPILNINCTSLSITWWAFDKAIDSGESDVREYRIEIMSSSSKKFTNLTTVEGPATEANGRMYLKTFSDLPSDENYSVRIVPIFYVSTGGDEYSEDGLPSPSSHRISIAKGELLPTSVVLSAPKR